MGEYVAAAVAVVEVASAVYNAFQEPEPQEISVVAPTFAAPSGGGNAVPIIQDLIQQQTNFITSLLPDLINPLTSRIGDQARIEAALLQLLSGTVPLFAEGIGEIASPLARHFADDAPAFAREFSSFVDGASKIGIPAVNAASGALVKIIEAMMKGEALPPESVLAVAREVLLMVRRVGGKDAPVWVAPLVQLVTRTLPIVLGKQERRLDELLVDETTLDPRMALSFAGLPTWVTAGLTSWMKPLLYLLAFLGWQFGPELIKKLEEIFPELRNLAATAGDTAGNTIFDAVDLLHLASGATMEKGSEILFGRLNRKLDELAGEGANNVEQVAPQLLSMALGLGMSAHLVSVLAEKFSVFKQLGFPQLAAFMVDMAGFQRIAQNTIGVQMETALRSPGLRHARRRFRSELPGPGVFDQLYLERKVDDEQFREFYRAQGWPEELIESYREAVFREAPPRELAIVFEDAEVDEEWIDRQLREQGYSDEDATLLRGGVKARSQKGPRLGLIGAVLDAYEDGLYNEGLLVEYLQHLRLRENTLRLLLATANHRRYRKELTTRRAALEAGAAIGQFTGEQLAAELAALGYDARAQQQATRLADIKQAKEIFEDERADVKGSIRRAQAKQIETALDLHRRFRLDDGDLRIVLVGYGVRAGEVDALVALAGVRRTPVPRLPTELSPAAAVQAKLDQMVDQVLALQAGDVIDEGGAIALLVGLGLTSEEASLQAGLVAARRAGPQIAEREREAERLAAERKREADRAQEQARAAERLRHAEAERELGEILRDLEGAAIANFRRGLIDEDRLFVQLVGFGRSEPAADALVQREAARRPPTKP